MEIKISNAARDAQLVSDLQLHASRESYSELMNLYFNRVYALMLKMTGDALDAEDLTMEVFAKAFSSIQSYTPRYAFSTWLFRIARNHCIDFLRQNKKENTFAVNDSDHSLQVASAQPDPEEAMIKVQQSQFLHEVVSSLKPNYQAIIELFYFKEYSIEEIAKELRIPENTVKIRLFRARDLLTKILNPG